MLSPSRMCLLAFSRIFSDAQGLSLLSSLLLISLEGTFQNLVKAARCCYILRSLPLFESLHMRLFP